MPDDDALRAVAAVPAGFRRAPSVGAWMAVVQAHPAVAALRPQGRRSLLAVCWALTGFADRRTAVCRPGWENLQSSCGLSRSTMASWLAWLRHRRLIGHAESGSTPQYRKGNGDDGAGNRAAVYVLLTPDPNNRPDTAGPDETDGSDSSGVSGNDGTRTPSYPYGDIFPTAPAREGPGQKAALRAAGSQPNQNPPPAWPCDRPARTGRDRLAAAETLAYHSPPCRRLSSRHLRHVIRPFMQAGWAIRDITFALDHTPDGAVHRYAYHPDELYNPAGWITWRLAHWIDDDHTVTPGRYQHHPTDNQPQVADTGPHNGPRQPRPAPEEPDEPDTPVNRDQLAADKAALRTRLAKATARRDAELAAKQQCREQAAAQAHLEALQAVHALPDPDQNNTGSDTEDGERARSERIRRAAIARARAEKHPGHSTGPGGGA